MRSDDWDDPDDWVHHDDAEDLPWLDEEEEETVPPSKVYTLADMEKHGEAGARAVDELLAINPDTPTKELLAAMRQHVLPLSQYRATEEEMLALRRADILHTLRGDKVQGKQGDTEEEEDVP